MTTKTNTPGPTTPAPETRFPRALLAEVFGALVDQPERLTASAVTSAAISSACKDLGTVIDALGAGSTAAETLKGIRRRLTCADDFAELLESEEAECEGGIPHLVSDPETGFSPQSEAKTECQAPTDFDRAADAVHDALCSVHASLETTGDTARAAALEAVIQAFGELRGGLQAPSEARSETRSGAEREPEKAAVPQSPTKRRKPSALDISGALETLDDIRPQLDRMLVNISGMAEHLDKGEIEGALSIHWALQTVRGELQWSGEGSNLDGALEHLGWARDAVVDVLITMAATRSNYHFEAGDWEDAAEVLRAIWLATEELKGGANGTEAPGGQP